MIKALIIDDEKMARESLHFLIKKLEDIEVVEAFESAIDARKFLVENKVDAIFLDVEMPGLSGIEFLASAKDLPQIILTTNNPEHAVEAFEYEVLDFLTKPVSFIRLNKAVDRLRSQQRSGEQDNREDFFVRSEGRYVRIPFDDLLYVETLDDYVVLHMKDKNKHIVHSTLSKMEQRLPDQKFQKTHRSYIVNLSKIADVEETTLVIEKAVIPISRAFRVILKERLGLK